MDRKETIRLFTEYNFLLSPKDFTDAEFKITIQKLNASQYAANNLRNVLLMIAAMYYF